MVSGGVAAYHLKTLRAGLRRAAELEPMKTLLLIALGASLGACMTTSPDVTNATASAPRCAAYTIQLSRGIIRVGLSVPASAEFELVAVDDPYHFASATELSLFRRPLPTANLKFDSTVMWDGREVVPGQPVSTMLLNQASDATVGHAQGHPLSQAQRQSIVDFE